MSSDRVIRLGPKVTLKLKTSSPKPANSDPSHQSSAPACPPVEASRSQKKRSRDDRRETDMPSIPSSAIQPVRVIAPLKRKITIATDRKSDVNHSQENEAMDCSDGGDDYASEHFTQDCEMSAPADPPGAPVSTPIHDDWEMALW